CNPLALADGFTPVEDNACLLETRFNEEAVFVFVFPEDVTGSVNLTLLVLFIGVTATNLSLKLLMQGRIVETIHVDFDELTAMAFEQSSSGPALQDIIPGTISSGLVQKPSSSASYVPPSRNDWDLLFQPLFDELLNPPTSVDNQAVEVIAPIAEVIPQVDDDSTGSPSSTTVDQDAPSPSKSPTPTKTQSSAILQDVGNDNLNIEVAHMGNDPLLGVPITEVSSGQSSSTTSP
nr:hypothetical protein [Tanacetum cinerariifolium]